MPKSHRQIKSNSRLLKVLLLIIIIAISLFLLKFFLFNNRKPVNEDQIGWNKNISDFSQHPPQAPPLEPVLNNNITTAPLAPPPLQVKDAQIPCQKTTKKLVDFFKHLDEQEYIIAYELEIPLKDYIINIINTLLKNPPIINQETDDLFTVLKNTAHFYRILGHKDLSLIKDILTYENEDREYIMSLFYDWSLLAEKCKNDALFVEMPLNKTYEYASFFLNTLGGQSYLFRRDSRLRVLTRYYCMLILEQSINKSANKYNIDEIYTLESIIEDMKNADSLENQNQYLASLLEIKARLAKR